MELTEQMTKRRGPTPGVKRGPYAKTRARMALLAAQTNSRSTATKIAQSVKNNYQIGANKAWETRRANMAKAATSSAIKAATKAKAAKTTERKRFRSRALEIDAFTSKVIYEMRAELSAKAGYPLTDTQVVAAMARRFSK